MVQEFKKVLKVHHLCLWRNANFLKCFSGKIRWKPKKKSNTATAHQNLKLTILWLFQDKVPEIIQSLPAFISNHNSFYVV